MSHLNWPVLRRYSGEHLDRISLPIGGIGTGTIGLGGRGQLRDFELANRPAKGFRPGVAFLAMRAEHPDGRVVARVLEGPIPPGEYEGAAGSTAANHGLPRFAEAEFETAYPFGAVVLSDPEMPTVTLGAFNPLVPCDVERSSLPVAIVRVTVRNPGPDPLTVSVAAAVENFTGPPGDGDDAAQWSNTLRTAPGLTGVVLGSRRRRHPADGKFALAIVHGDGGEVTARRHWAERRWAHGIADFWDDFVSDGVLDAREESGGRPIASVCEKVMIAPGASREVEILMSWAFPNRMAWRSDDVSFDDAAYTDENVGNHYTDLWPDPWATACSTAERLDELESATVEAVSAIIGSAVPEAIVEAALFNLSTLRSPTVFRTRDGAFFGWEGVLDTVGSCFGTCTHVWGYEFATAFLFGEISRSFRETQFLWTTDVEGRMSFRAGLPRERSRDYGLAAADGQMASLVHLYLDWTLSGDQEFLERLWPAARSCLEFAWVPGGWDADRDGVMEGCQHNTMDVEFYGPHPQMTSWYLAALHACAAMADAVGEPEFAADCRRLAASGAAWVDAQLFTGTHYRQLIVPVDDPASIARGLRHPDMGSSRLDDPELQLGDGVLIDQLAGQYASRIAGLGELLEPAHVRRALETIRQRNGRTELRTHVNPMRSFALGDEAGLLMCSYTPGRMPSHPFPYHAEVMTGFEYTVATSMIYEGLPAEGLQVVRDVRDRYDGRKRNPFDEAEMGHHYARALASWSTFVAWTGFGYDARTGVISFARGTGGGSTFWATGDAWGTWTEDAASDGGRLEVLGGRVYLSAVVLRGRRLPLAETRVYGRGAAPLAVTE